ncbi:hypothetical protein Pla123a_02710 [Posidoniimonas polymericola]|uniref:Matrixin n=1 Tax=Posidoniimonas polymericola TaxID=2528002 RepID=A0A5C5ZDP2_9BACT|nr:zinc-dependent metalloprotease family protein [Posidoniimonas polymericola]TWT85464.1 hypothetical protein Pla123a_02710 [Posidoniimonas polymericola]
MNRIQTAWTALAACAMLVLSAGQAPAVVLPVHDEDHLVHVVPEAAGVAEGVGLYSYDSRNPVFSSGSATVPAFNSRPSASAQLFLDFDGVDYGFTSWSGKLPRLRPAYDVDGDASTFGTNELSRIEQIWSRVSEAYSMFDINVTTVDPGNYNRRESAHVVISGDNDWYGSGGGVAFIGGFYSSGSGMVQRTAWVFPDNLRGGDAKVVADAAIHEAGHLFGLRHQSSYNDDGTLNETYDNNSDSILQAPNMGVAYNARRGLWSVGPTTSASSSTNDITTIGSTSSNRFGFVDDEAGTSFFNAELYTPSSTPQRGVIASTADSDYYRIEIDNPSEVSLLVDVAEYGPNLDARLALYDSSFALLYEDDPVLSTSRRSLIARYEGVLAAGDYYLQVTSHGGLTYDSGRRDRFLQDSGQYFLSGLVTAMPVPEPAAALLLAVCAGVGLRGRRR